VRADAHTLAVEQMRLGDHAFAHYADDRVRWEVPAVFAHQGLARGEKVIIMGDPACSADEAYEQLAAYGGRAEAARASGQLAFSSMRALIGPDREFTALRQMGRLHEETVRARQEGFAGLRTVIDMAWVQDLGTAVEDVMRREKQAGSLFGSRQYAEICTYDRRRFDSGVVEEMWSSHPVALLERPGDLQAWHAVGEVSLVGDADLATIDTFREAMRTALARPSGGQVLVNLTRLCFLSGGCAGELLRLAEQARAVDRVVVRCRSSFQARILSRLGAARIGKLVLEETVNA
jgi:anti-anti-sigma regulatory factor